MLSMCEIVQALTTENNINISWFYRQLVHTCNIHFTVFSPSWFEMWISNVTNVSHRLSHVVLLVDTWFRWQFSFGEMGNHKYSELLSLKLQQTIFHFNKIENNAFKMFRQQTFVSICRKLMFDFGCYAFIHWPLFVHSKSIPSGDNTRFAHVCKVTLLRFVRSIRRKREHDLKFYYHSVIK